MRKFYYLFFFEPQQDGYYSIFIAEHLDPAGGTPALLNLVCEPLQSVKYSERTSYPGVDNKQQVRDQLEGFHPDKEKKKRERREAAGTNCFYCSKSSLISMTVVFLIQTTVTVTGIINLSFFRKRKFPGEECIICKCKCYIPISVSGQCLKHPGT